MSGGLPRVPNSTATIKYNGSSVEPGISVEEQVARRRKELGTMETQAPDVADIALRDATSGRVRRVRGGSTRESIFGQAMALGPIVLLAISIWLRHLIRGE
jgi:hypothetical protein